MGSSGAKRGALLRARRCAAALAGPGRPPAPGLLPHHRPHLLSSSLALDIVSFGSLQGLLLFISLGDAIQSLGFKYHLFGDYIQVCTSALTSEPESCISKPAAWPFHLAVSRGSYTELSVSPTSSASSSHLNSLFTPSPTGTCSDYFL